MLRGAPQSLQSLQVNDKNVEDIKLCLEHKTVDWFSEDPFDTETCNQIRKMLAPLTSKADGQCSQYTQYMTGAKS